MASKQLPVTTLLQIQRAFGPLALKTYLPLSASGARHAEFGSG